MAEQLQANGNPITIEGVTISTPGLTGTVDAHLPAPAEVRAMTSWTDALTEAFEAQDVHTQLILDMTNTQEVPHLAPPGSRSTSHGEPAIVLDVPDPGESFGQVVVYTDESGVTTWNYPMTATSEVSTTRGGATRTFVIPRRVPPAQGPEAGETRGAFGSFAKKLLGIVIFPILDPIFGKIGETFARKWEEQRRPYRFRAWTPEDYRAREADEADWGSLDGSRSLLMVHGTFSQAHTAFGSFPKTFMEDLHTKYDGRVFAFDHFTLSDAPKDNIEWFVKNLPPGISLDVDIICHSRGGLVSRVLAERIGDFETGDRQVKVGKIAFIATPNAGTILADAKYLSDWIDSYTNILNFSPPNLVTDALEGVITVVKHIAVGTLKGLDGLQSMHPTGDFLKWLNTKATNPTEYFALAANYEPVNAGWAQFVKDRVMDSIFGGKNDLVVPTGSVYAGNGSSHFPITDRLEFDEDDGIDHSGFMARKEVQDQLLAWLETANADVPRRGQWR